MTGVKKTETKKNKKNVRTGLWFSQQRSKCGTPGCEVKLWKEGVKLNTWRMAVDDLSLKTNKGDKT